MKYFIKSELEKSAAWTEMIEAEQNLTSPKYMNDPALAKLSGVLRDIEARKPLGAGKNPDPTTDTIMPDMGFPKLDY